MPLDEYRRKRDFSKTPRAAGGDGQPRERTGGRAEAAVLLRAEGTSRAGCTTTCGLEHGGVLLSWAVPKGPSLDHRDRHLGGADRGPSPRLRRLRRGDPGRLRAQGVVMLWDYGTWRPEVDGVGRGPAQGRPEVHPRRVQAQGVVGTGPHPRPARHRRRRSRAGAGCSSSTATSGRAPLDVTAFAPLSVKSEGDFDDILAADLPDVWVTGARRRPRGRHRQGAARDHREGCGQEVGARRDGRDLIGGNGACRPDGRPTRGLPGVWIACAAPDPRPRPVLVREPTGNRCCGPWTPGPAPPVLEPEPTGIASTGRTPAPDPRRRTGADGKGPLHTA